MSTDYAAIVIGSGLGGLTAGVLLSHAGLRVLVLEKNNSFGGAAMIYHKGGMTIEASLHETTDPRTIPDTRGGIFEALDLYKDVEPEHQRQRSMVYGLCHHMRVSVDSPAQRLPVQSPQKPLCRVSDSTQG